MMFDNRRRTKRTDRYAGQEGVSNAPMPEVLMKDPDTGAWYATLDAVQGIMYIQHRWRGEKRIHSVTVARLAQMCGYVLVPEDAVVRALAEQGKVPQEVAEKPPVEKRVVQIKSDVSDAGTVVDDDDPDESTEGQDIASGERGDEHSTSGG